MNLNVYEPRTVLPPDTVAKAAIQLVTYGLPKVVEAVGPVLATPRSADSDGVWLEHLVRANPEVFKGG